MKSYALYERATGRILQSFTSDDEANADHDASVLESATVGVLETTPDVINDAIEYVRLADLTVQPRAALPAFSKLAVTANGTDAASVSGLPNPTHVRIDGAASDAFDVADGVLSLSFSTPGVYVVTLDAGPAYRSPSSSIVAT